MISWLEGKNEKFGIVDCSSENDNPILKRLQEIGLKEIEFIIISHPHIDHYSGIMAVFDYCLANKVLIKRVCYTFSDKVFDVYEDYYSFNNQTLLHSFCEFIQSYSRGKYSDLKRVDKDTMPLALGSGIKINFKSPNQAAILRLATRTARNKAGLTTSIPDLNIYSTILEIEVEEKLLLLTADAPRSYFKNLKTHYSWALGERKFYLVQIPHHGSSGNFYESFWTDLPRVESCKAVFSVGDEPSDRLPKRAVVEKIQQLKYDIYSTNCVYGINDVFSCSPIQKKSKLPDVFDAFSTSVSAQVTSINGKYQGDQVFAF